MNSHIRDSQTAFVNAYALGVCCGGLVPLFLFLLQKISFSLVKVDVLCLGEIDLFPELHNLQRSDVFGWRTSMSP